MKNLKMLLFNRLFNKNRLYSKYHPDKKVLFETVTLIVLYA